ncbi:Fe-S cluster assembly protein SufD [Lentisphaera profundi]|uniref:Fe-S cluster assembly protein SufD n=1 Tax=Lentisphaera profundi TaxID=1658616 RepID=A0ABY7VU81_9BACT|nr:Fe-S cluster assembly protein SufD [Lentisphaera profundi]WDE96775.1 Fe-S cluster assembly protein SufD [Lentisphaera profundi]
MTQLPKEFINQELIESETGTWLSDFRKSHAAKVIDLEFPGRANERWKYTPLRGVLELSYSASPSIDLNEAQVKDHRLAGSIELVFVNGGFSEELSIIPATLPKGFTIAPVSVALAGNSAHDVQNILEYEGDGEEDVFETLNKSSFRDGAFIKVSKGAYSETPIHILNFSSAEQSTVNFSRHMIYLEDGAIASVIETCANQAGELKHINNIMTDVVLQERSLLTYSRLQVETEQSINVSALRARIGADAKFNSSVFSAGGALSRHFMDVELNGKHAETDLQGLFTTKGEMHADNRGIIRHKVPECESNQLYKGVLDDSSRGVFNGIVNIARDAQLSNANQMNRNLLLSRKARVDAKPELDVYADDVKAAHGAAIGQLDASELFYLQTRCISREQAIQMLIKGFMHEVIDKAPAILKPKLDVIFDNYFDAEDVLTC